MKMFIDQGTYIALEGSGFCPQHHKEQMRQKVKLSRSRKKKKAKYYPLHDSIYSYVSAIKKKKHTHAFWFLSLTMLYSLLTVFFFISGCSPCNYLVPRLQLAVRDMTSLLGCFYIKLWQEELPSLPTVIHIAAQRAAPTQGHRGREADCSADLLSLRLFWS